MFISASLSETQGLTYIEAMASNIPVIARYYDQLVDVIEDGKNGYIIPVNSVKKLAEKLTFILSEKDFYEEMRKGCLKTAEAYTIEKMSEAYEKILQRYECSET